MKKYKVLRLNNEGRGIVKDNDKIVFVENAMPDEEITIEIFKEHKNYSEAKIKNIINESKNRVEPVCPYYYNCGGCNLMHMNKDYQLKFKKEKVINIFDKMCKEKINPEIYSFNEYYYRNKIVLKVINNKIGFYKSKSNEIVEIDECIISNKKINEIIKRLIAYTSNNKFLDTEIMIRSINNEIMLSIDKLNDIKSFINEFKDINSIYVNKKLVYGNSKLLEEINGYKFYISPESFFQINKETTKKLYDKVLSYIDENDLTLDLYSGTGTISILLSKNSKKVIGVEVVKEAVKDANENLKLNNINNVEFYEGKVEDVINKLKNLKVNNIVLDPPRSGCNKKGIEVIKQIKPNKIIYISCNPLTLARDYNYLKNDYDLTEITLYDMFVNSYHIESLLVLERR